MTILYCDCFSGISGDMFLAALLDAGLPREYLEEQFRRLGLSEFVGVSVERVSKGALAAAQLKLDIHDDKANQSHRHLSDIQTLIEKSNLPKAVQEISLKIFHKLAEAEAKVHGSTIEEVHFHEVGAVDSILDVVGAAVGLDYFDVQAVYASALPLGSGKVETQHGLLPLPAPATLELLRMVQAPIIASPATVEMVTPTGAAILATLATFRQPEMRLQHIGIGAGRRNMPWPNVLRILIGVADTCSGTHVEIETNIDDMNPQLYGYVMDKLFEAGALDVYFTPIYMKKNRPATKLSVIAFQSDEQKLCDLLLQETSTLGIRIKPISRHEAHREIRKIITCYGEVPVKVKVVDGKVTQVTPEFDVCVRLAKEANIPLAKVIQEAAKVGMEIYSG